MKKKYMDAVICIGGAFVCYSLDAALAGHFCMLSAGWMMGARS